MRSKKNHYVILSVLLLLPVCLVQIIQLAMTFKTTQLGVVFCPLVQVSLQLLARCTTMRWRHLMAHYPVSRNSSAAHTQAFAHCGPQFSYQQGFLFPITFRVRLFKDRHNVGFDLLDYISTSITFTVCLSVHPSALSVQLPLDICETEHETSINMID